MINALLAHSFRAAEMAIPWQIVPMVLLGLIAVCAVFKGIYWIVGKWGLNEDAGGRLSLSRLWRQLPRQREPIRRKRKGGV